MGGGLANPITSEESGCTTFLSYIGSSEGLHGTYCTGVFVNVVDRWAQRQLYIYACGIMHHM